MARGTSGRVVIEIDPNKKQRLHAALALDGQTLKGWFVGQVDTYLEQSSLKGIDRTRPIERKLGAEVETDHGE
jgi:hypothetical protein